MAQPSERTRCRTLSGFSSNKRSHPQGCPMKVGQPWAVLHNAFGVELRESRSYVELFNTQKPNVDNRLLTRYHHRLFPNGVRSLFGVAPRARLDRRAPPRGVRRLRTEALRAAQPRRIQARRSARVSAEPLCPEFGRCPPRAVRDGARKESRLCRRGLPYRWAERRRAARRKSRPPRRALRIAFGVARRKARHSRAAPDVARRPRLGRPLFGLARRLLDRGDSPLRPAERHRRSAPLQPDRPLAARRR